MSDTYIQGDQYSNCASELRECPANAIPNVPALRALNPLRATLRALHAFGSFLVALAAESESALRHFDV